MNAPAIHLSMLTVERGHEDGFDRWFRDRHLPRVLEQPGWRRAHRYACTLGEPSHLTIHGSTKGASGSAVPFRDESIGRRVRDYRGETFRLVLEAHGEMSARPALLNAVVTDVEPARAAAFDAWVLRRARARDPRLSRLAQRAALRERRVAVALPRGLRALRRGAAVLQPRVRRRRRLGRARRRPARLPRLPRLPPPLHGRALVSDFAFEPLQERDGRRVSRSPSRGCADEIGRLNWMTAESRAAVLARATGALFDLAVTYRHGMPAYQATGDPSYQIFLTHTPDGTRLDDLTGEGEQVNARYSYAGTASRCTRTGRTSPASTTSATTGASGTAGRRARTSAAARGRSGGDYPPVIARGVLLDVAAALGVDCLADSYAITAADLGLAERRAGVEVRRGDVVLVRTGRMTRWGDPAAFMADPPGLGMEAARHSPRSPGRCAWASMPGARRPPPQGDARHVPAGARLPAGHRRDAGLEHLWLEDLAAAGVGEFAFVATPLKLAGSTGCPVRPIAIALQ